ncbi:UDP-N-acetylglucosamine 2-epimerase (non-hydrolysing) [Roseimicrobium gellanilyticum]|uniref:UDP-N-acetylglucosamine 2-epimerase (Non-hydrolysing) n=1 Tax=Roseimicrobium gellanilyticum TaxID=748857 RepID=A0A366HTX9_9BACT|nr:UDP-N-acetylglucosamine 2-epimerase (non-hydrolyzing) [Roseimicrobium gellanilyticum]RBP46157.1 UDP-N-acetylglucosamine 2-epimerase (non-hydrolysing) [Roseimicrobium gellanilyticum]
MSESARARLKVMTVVGTRPEIIRMSRVIPVLDSVADHVLVHTGQNFDYELNGIFFDQLEIRRPDILLEVAGATAAESIANTILKVDAVLEEEKPEALLVLGDTNSALCVIPAKRRRIPIFHMEAGNRCFDQRVPEEINRRIVDHVSDMNLCYTEHARRNLLREGLPEDRVIKTGSPMKEVLDHHAAKIRSSDILSRLGLERERYFVVSIHREENVDDPGNLTSLAQALGSLAEEFQFPMIVSLHPRTRKRMEAGGHTLHPLLRTMPPLGFPDYVALQCGAYCTLSDSGTITEESALMGFPAVTLREAHERPEGMDEGVLVMSGLCERRIRQAVAITVAQHRSGSRPRVPADYLVEQVSWKVAKIICGYTDYVRRVVWHAREANGHAEAPENSKPARV